MGTLRLTQGGLFASGHFELGLLFPPSSLFGASQGKSRHVQVSLKDAVFLLFSETTACLDPWRCSWGCWEGEGTNNPAPCKPHVFLGESTESGCPPNQHLPSLAGSCSPSPALLEKPSNKPLCSLWPLCCNCQVLLTGEL